MQCPLCGGEMVGDGYTSVLHCEFAESDLTVAPDSTPIYCDFDEEAES